MNNIKFVSYTGVFPNLCRGVLTLIIDGKEVKFGHEIEDFIFNENTKKFECKNNNFDRFWESGGEASIDSDNNSYCYSGEWIINKEELPEQYRKYSEKITEIFNKYVPHGCCGGCV